MKQHILLLCLVLPCVLFPVGAMAAKPIDHYRFQPLTDVDVWLDPLGWHWFRYTNLDTSDTIYYDFEVTDGSGIDFFICDQENYNYWSDFDIETTAYVYELTENTGGASGSFNVQSSGTWYVVFSNADSLGSKHVEGYIGLSPQMPLTNIDPTILIALFLGIAFIAIIVGLGKRAAQSQSPSAVTYQPKSVPVTTHRPSTAPKAFCPYCGTTRQPPNAPYCSSCGKHFGDAPEIQ
ncbi:MAG: zinc ribbon domain-containing protein [Promethearchaeota archaeon]